MDAVELVLRFDAELWVFLGPRHRRPIARVRYDGTSSLGHVVESLGVPLPEVGELVVGGIPRLPAFRPHDGDDVTIRPVRRPQPLPPAPRFVLDVHLGTLARRLRLLGVDAEYDNDRDDDTLIEVANNEHRVLLTQDRGLLRRRALWYGGYVRGSDPDAQLADVLARFAPPLAPWTRCLACGGPLTAVAKGAIDDVLRPGTRRSYQDFVRCRRCGHVYWRGAHHRRLAAIVAAALAQVSRAEPTDLAKPAGKPHPGR